MGAAAAWLPAFANSRHANTPTGQHANTLNWSTCSHPSATYGKVRVEVAFAEAGQMMLTWKVHSKHRIELATHIP